MLKHAEFYVLRRNRIRAALAECGFLTNLGDPPRRAVVLPSQTGHR
ncbi:MAG: hypothetical protein JWN34_5003 [Bryobacterales bacterium]|nr:hypothetical protein [Bryobacterales bacterium]